MFHSLFSPPKFWILNEICLLKFLLPAKNVTVSLSPASLEVGLSPPSKDPFLGDHFLLIFKPLWRALCVWQC